MILFLHGPDSYRSRHKLNEIIDHYKKSVKSGLNLSFIDATQADFSELQSLCATTSMFKEKKLIVVKNCFSNKQFQEALIGEWATLHQSDDVVILYEANAPDARLKLFKLLVKECKCQEFAVLSGKNLEQWVQKGFETGGQKITLDAIKTLISFVGNDLWRMAQEIQKLSAFKQGAGIRGEDVELQVRATIENDIFKTIDALAAHNKQQATLLVQKHLENGDNALYLLSMVAYQVKNLLSVKELAEKGLMYNSIVTKSGLHPFVVRKTYFSCQQFSLEKLKELYKRIFQLDSDIKQGKFDAEVALNLLVSEV